LHWFQSVRDHHEAERKRAEERARDAREDEKLRQTLALTIKRLDTHQKVSGSTPKFTKELVGL
jgi:hypothetical protein